MYHNYNLAGLFSDEGHNNPTSVGTVIAMTLVYASDLLLKINHRFIGFYWFIVIPE